jgi:Ca2+ transporting ATPase
MLKHIIGQSIFQFTVMIILIFWGELFIPEYSDSYDSTIFAANPSEKWYNGIVGGTVRSGRFHTIVGGDDYITVYDATHVYSRHFTFIFNAFVMMQVFNFLNARKLHEEVFHPLFSLTYSKE